jgi:hypothetical protein
MRLLAIDPGTIQSGWCILEDGKLTDCGVMENESMLAKVHQLNLHNVVIEMIASYGMAVGKETFETCVWIGRFMQAAEGANRLFRSDIKLHLCHTARAKDTNIWQAILDRYGGKERAVGNKKQPGPLYGVKSHARAALALGLAWTDGVRSKGI